MALSWSRGARTPDLLHAMQALVPAELWPRCIRFDAYDYVTRPIVPVALLCESRLCLHLRLAAFSHVSGLRGLPNQRFGKVVAGRGIEPRTFGL